jgi:hypothetical protein
LVFAPPPPQPALRLTTKQAISASTNSFFTASPSFPEGSRTKTSDLPEHPGSPKELNSISVSNYSATSDFTRRRGDDLPS